jgi:effector-binding domain-containing protein
MVQPIEVTNSEATPTAVIRERVAASELPRFVPAACGEVWSFIRSANLLRPGRHVAVYLDRAGSVEVGAEVGEPFTGNERVHCSRLPAGRAATAVHFGPYGRLSEAHIAIRQWCAEHRHRLTGISWEIYGHWDESWNQDPSKIRSDVFYQIDESSAA